MRNSQPFDWSGLVFITFLFGILGLVLGGSILIFLDEDCISDPNLTRHICRQLAE